jgi:hypothetical protein
VPRVHLATDVLYALPVRGDPLQPPDGAGVERGLQERDLIALRVGRDLRERVAVDDCGELGPRANDDADLEIEALGEKTLDVPADALRRLAAREDDVSALDVRCDVGEVRVLERLSQRRHRDAVAAREIDAAQEDDETAHAA